MILTLQEARILQFVQKAHGTQVRKYTNEPYWFHLWNVANILQDHGHRYLTPVALCHDLLEDTGVSAMDLRVFLDNIGYGIDHIDEIESSVQDLTDSYPHELYPELGRKARKRNEADRLSHTHRFSQTVKYADIIDNTSTIIERDPAFAEVYLQEKKHLLSVMDDGDPILWSKACKIVGLK